MRGPGALRILLARTFPIQAHRLTYRDRFVLKGGLLLTVLGLRRPTRDADVLARGVAGDEENLLAVMGEIMYMPADDGITFHASSARVSVIREHAAYPGLRISVPGPRRSPEECPGWVRTQRPYAALCYWRCNTVLMTVQHNPFVYGSPITREEDLADREDEKRSVRGDVVSGQAVMLHAPRRYGKTSLARVVAERLQEEGTPYIYADLWGVRSIPDVVGVFGKPW